MERHGDTLFSETELCDGLDNDCDGLVDESFSSLGEACSEGLGDCEAQGSLECDPADPSRMRCSATPLEPGEPGAEQTCSGGGDEDCDGWPDCDDPDCAFDPQSDDESSNTFVCKHPECGDGFLDVGEACDDGNLEDGNCCSDACTFQPFGFACDGEECGHGHCDGLGSCVLSDFDPSCQLPSLVDLPIAIDCCAVSDQGCNLGSYCSRIEAPINPCPLSTGEVGTCLEFSSVPEMNACWSVFDGEYPAINNPEMLGIIEGGPVRVDAGPVYADNGDKTVATRSINDRMQGLGDFQGDPAGLDRYPPFHVPPFADSWVVRLPVLECQNPGEFCGPGRTQELIGALCFEIREIDPLPSRIIRGRFLCPETDPELFAQCELGPLFTD